jgi:hypothetical protein
MKKLVCVLFITLALPVVGALSDHSRHEAQAFNAVAVAGHVQIGGQPTGQYCSPCGCSHSNCVCDPGEDAGPCPPEEPLMAESSNGGDGAGALLMLFAVGFTLRMIRRR